MSLRIPRGLIIENLIKLPDKRMKVNLVQLELRQKLYLKTQILHYLYRSLRIYFNMKFERWSPRYTICIDSAESKNNAAYIQSKDLY